MMRSDFTTQVEKLISQNTQHFSALHGTSISFIEKLLSAGQIYQEGNSQNHFYVLVPTQTKGVDILESATYYANINAIKDLLFSQNKDFQQKVTKSTDQYSFLAGLGQLADNPKAIDVVNLESFSEDLDFIKSGIQTSKLEDRQGLIVYFNDQFLKDFEIIETTETGQAKVFLSRPITFKHIQSIQLLGEYEKTFLNHQNNS